MTSPNEPTKNNVASKPADAGKDARDQPVSNFIRTMVQQDMETGKWDGRVVTRFPPEPNGYLHIGHAKAFCLNFGLAEEFGGHCNLRFDDTNPAREDDEFVRSIQEDIAWMGWSWGDNLFFASDYFDQMFEWAIQLINEGKAFVCDLNAEEMREYRGTLKEPGKNSPYRDRPVEENLDLFHRMRAGEFPDGSRTLRAKIDMAAPNMNLRDPVMYRILHQHHHRQGDKWCVYPTYDWAHGLEDSIERVTHSLCSLEFEDHRPLYNWYLEALGIYHPEQTEFARLNLTYTVMSKRLLRELVEQNHVNGWDDPRMPTLSGMRRRGYPPAAIRTFMEKVGISKANSTVDFAMLESCIRDDLNKNAARVMAVLDPLKVVIENYPDDAPEDLLDAVNNPEDPEAGERQVPFAKEIYIERADFMEDAPKKFFRLAPGREVRLRYAYFITCTDVVKDADGNVVELRCTYDPETRGGNAPDGRKVKGTIHWVSAKHAVDAEVRLYDHLFAKENPSVVEEGGHWTDNLNPESLEVITGKLEPYAASLPVGTNVQFERMGYFRVDEDSKDGAVVYNRTATLRDTWAKMNQGGGKK